MSAALDTTDVHLGHWVNWSLGNSIRGSTLTLTRRDGALLTAFLAMFVAFAGTRIWRITAFGIYLSLARGSPQDALFHQRQAILRNSSTADGDFWKLCRVFWAWRKSGRLVYRKLGPLALLSLAAGVGFAVAGVFSSRISSSTGTEVLLSGQGCAWLNGTSLTSQDAVTILQPYNSELIQDASQRAQQCYTSNVSTGSCQTFVKPSIPFSVTRDAACPFDQRICQSNTSNLLLDTGYLDSHDDFGINAPPAKRITSRFVLQCAPLVLEGYSSVAAGPTYINGTTLQSESKQPWMRYFYGPASEQRNFTYQYPLIHGNASKDIGNSLYNTDFTISASSATANNSLADISNFAAIPELARTDTDTIVAFLSPNSVLFSSPVDDPWYSVHQGPYNISIAGGAGLGTSQLWTADNPVNVLGCAYQMQVCNPNIPRPQGCGPLTSPETINHQVVEFDVPPVSSPWTDATEEARFSDFIGTWSSFSSNVDRIIQSMGSAALSSRENFNNGFQGMLLPNQWQLDVEYWFSIQLASIQRAFAETANGPKYPGLETHLWPPESAVDFEFCSNQKIQSSDYTSFSTLGLVLTFVFGGIFIIVSYFLAPFLHWIQRRWRWDNYALTEWWINETLQLQSFLHEEIGVGTWTREIGLIPTTKPGEQLATLDFSNPGRPRFKEPQPTWDKFSAGNASEEKCGAAQRIEDIKSSRRSSSTGGDSGHPDALDHDHNAVLDISRHDSTGHDGEDDDEEKL